MPVSPAMGEAQRMLDAIHPSQPAYMALKQAMGLHTAGTLPEADLADLTSSLAKLEQAQTRLNAAQNESVEIDFERRKTAFLTALNVQFKMMNQSNYLAAVAGIAAENGFRVRNFNDGVAGGLDARKVLNDEKAKLKRYQLPDETRFGLIILNGEVQVFKQVAGNREGDWILQGLE